MNPDNSESVSQDANTGNWLSKYARNTFSQFGEDGIVEKILSILPHCSKWCVEFGAWDGKHSSNTHLLLSQKEWSGVLIEADKNKFKDLCRTYQGNNHVICMNKRVTFDGENVLDSILSETPIPEDFDILSIDIDGNDYHIWKSVVLYRPKLVMIEFNNTIPNCVEFVQEASFGVNQGSSLLSLCKLSKSKGYELVGVTEFNAFFVEAKYFPLFQIEDNSPEVINKNQKYITHVFQLYDGTLVWTGNLKLLWHDRDIHPEKLQVLPKFSRFFPESRVSWLRRFMTSCWKHLNL